MSTQKIFDAQAADGNSPVFKLIGGTLTTRGKATIFVSGTLDGTISFEVKDPDGNFIPAKHIADITEVGYYEISTTGFVGRAVLSGSTAPSVSVWVSTSTEFVKQQAV